MISFMVPYGLPLGRYSVSVAQSPNGPFSGSFSFSIVRNAINSKVGAKPLNGTNQLVPLISIEENNNNNNNNATNTRDSPVRKNRAKRKVFSANPPLESLIERRNAAVKIQASARGFLARKRLKEQLSSSSLQDQDKQQQEENIISEVAPTKPVDAVRFARAIVRIQSLFRGFLARRVMFRAFPYHFGPKAAEQRLKTSIANGEILPSDSEVKRRKALLRSIPARVKINQILMNEAMHKKRIQDISRGESLIAKHEEALAESVHLQRAKKVAYSQALHIQQSSATMVARLDKHLMHHPEDLEVIALREEALKNNNGANDKIDKLKSEYIEMKRQVVKRTNKLQEVVRKVQLLRKVVTSAAQLKSDVEAGKMTWNDDMESDVYKLVFPREKPLNESIASSSPEKKPAPKPKKRQQQPPRQSSPVRSQTTSSNTSDGKNRPGDKLKRLMHSVSFDSTISTEMLFERDTGSVTSHE